MALIIEDGTVVANANSFVSVAEIRAFATARGVTLPADDTAVEPFAIKAMDYIVLQEPRMQGYRTSPDTQELPYPRKCVRVFNAEVLSNAIPSTLKKAQMQLATDASQGIPILGTDVDGQPIKRDKTGPLETEWFGPGDGVSLAPDLAAATGYLNPLLVGNGFGLTTLRI